MPLTFLASFPNSRVKPRPARTAGSVKIISVPTGVATLIAPANANRTAIMVRNVDSTVDGWYGYSNLVNGTTIGELLKAGEPVTLDDPGDIWFIHSGPGAINLATDEGVG